MNNSLIQSRLYEIRIIGDISKAYFRIRVSQLDSVLRLFLWYDSELTIKVYKRCCMDFGDAQTALTLSIAQIKFIAPLLWFMMSLIIVIFCRFADNYSSSVSSVTEFKMVSADLKEAHDKLSLPLKCIWSDEKHDENNSVDENIPILGLLWNRKDDTIKFNGSFTLTKKNRMGHSKNLDISQIDKKFFKDLNWPKSNLCNKTGHITFNHESLRPPGGPFKCILN